MYIVLFIFGQGRRKSLASLQCYIHTRPARNVYSHLHRLCLDYIIANYYDYLYTISIHILSIILI